MNCQRNVLGPGYWPGIYLHLNLPSIILRRNREKMMLDYWPEIYRQLKLGAILTAK